MTNRNEYNTPDFVKLWAFGVGNVLVADTQKAVFIGGFENVCSEEDATGQLTKVAKSWFKLPLNWISSCSHTVFYNIIILL